MGIRNKLIEEVCRALSRLKTNEFEVRLRTEYGEPDENTREFLELVTEDFDAIRVRGDQTNLFVGRFLSMVLLIEKKLENLLIKIDPDIESKMLGRKIDTFARLLNELSEPQYDFDAEEIESYRSLLKPLREIARIRNSMAHDLRYTRFRLSDIPDVVRIGRSLRPNLARAVTLAPSQEKPIVAVANFSFILSEKTANLSHQLI